VSNNAPQPITPDRVPVSSLEGGITTLVHEVEREGRAKLFTRDGLPVAVLLAADEYERLLQEASLAKLVGELHHAEAELNAGQGVSQDEVERELEARWGA
jgi:PHD/YefM family antitoxin component YafN of YafNO toxin-antitoxin module